MKQFSTCLIQDEYLVTGVLALWRIYCIYIYNCGNENSSQDKLPYSWIQPQGKEFIPFWYDGHPMLKSPQSFKKQMIHLMSPKSYRHSDIK